MRERGRIHRSVSTWQQPVPPPASPERAAFVARVAERVLALGHHRLTVGIDGLTASGKTSFGHELAERIARAGRPVLRASLDDFKNPWRDRHLYDRESGEGYYRNAFDYPRIRALLLEPFGPNGSGECALCAIDPLTQIDYASILTVADDDAVLIVDGVFAFRPEINEYWDFRIWLEVSPEISVSRGTERDNDETIHRDRYLPAEQIYLAEVEPLPFMDVIIDNSTFANPLLL
ncbi:uridine kinase [Nocardia altamirensis]|uniref:uridine kinase n=1 Tax=Nocardia altamirensis TaxID=472158 RepID=UPI0008405CD9|nr:uridine kinase [Nocardia altamirensis]